MGIKKHTNTWTNKDEGLFYKTYFSFIKVAFNLTKSEMIVLQYLAIKMGTQNNVTSISSYFKKKMEEELNIKTNTIEHALGQLVKKKMLIHVARGVYKVNPKYFAKAQGKRVMAMRWSVVKQYNEETHKVTVYEALDDSPIDIEEIKEILGEGNDED